jgi:hypothetical protein
MKGCRLMALNRLIAAYRGGGFEGNYCRSLDEVTRQKLSDTAEKGKNEPIEIFACTPVETGIS